MLAADRDALICDLAETYGVFDYRGLPVSLLATLASGLRDDSRIKLKLAGSPVRQDTLLLALAVDALHFLAWTKTKNAQRGRSQPKSIAQALLRPPEPARDRIAVFDSPASFEAALAKAKEGEPNGN